MTKRNCGAVPYPSNTGYVTPDPILYSPEVWSFASEPNLHPMKIKVHRHKPGTSSGEIFVAPYGFSTDAMFGQPGSLIIDNKGNPVWFRPLSSPNLMNIDFRVQQLYGKPVLTFWQGTLASPPAYTNLPAAASEPGSCYYILDNSYRVIKTVTAQKGYTSDIHEFLLTPENTALLLSTKVVPKDLTPYGGPKKGFVLNYSIQEIDLKTDELLFFWSALDHLPLEDSFQPASSASSSSNIWDAYHFNSIGLTENEDEIIVSVRNTWTIYKIDKPTKKILWRLGGKQSDFKIGCEANFAWQHDARMLSNNIVSLFDDNCCQSETVPPGTPYAHGLVLKLNFKKMSAKMLRSYYHNPNLHVQSQGNVQTLETGHKFIGWGQQPYFSEFKEGGKMIYDAEIPTNNYTYRAYRHDWIGTPHYPPSLAVKKHTVFASWNGSTETKAWQVFAGSSPDHLKLIKTQAKSGFETAITVKSKGPYFQVKALDARGKVIGVSGVVQL